MYTVYSPHHHLHATGDVRLDGERIITKEVPERADVILSAVTAAGFGPVVPPTDFGLKPIHAVHDRDYVIHLRTAYDRYAAIIGSQQPVMAHRSAVDPRRAAERPSDFVELVAYYTYDFEDPILAGTWRAAYWGVQVSLTAADLVRRGERSAYALCRPPGHHATRDQYGGFCYLNNAAAAARYLAQEGTVAILDLDYHHGNGTQAIFYNDPSVFYVSLHADPSLDYPYYWGYASERGAGAGTGTNLNLPLPLHCDDARYLLALDQALEAIGAYGPVYLVVSLGLDAVGGDTIGKFDLTLAGWATAGRRTASLGLPTVLVQEGGYRLDMLGVSAATFLCPFAVSRELRRPT